MGRYYSRDETEFGAFGDAPSRFGATTAAVAADFFDSGNTLAAPVVRAPVSPTGYVPGSLPAKAKVTAAATKTANVNAAGYTAARAASDRAAIATSNISAKDPAMLKGTGAWNFAGQDLGLLPLAGKIVVPLIATAATGGLAAPSLYAAGKSLTAAKATVASGNVKGTLDLVKKADALVSDAERGVDSAKRLIADTKSAAAAGVPDAVKGLSVLVAVDSARVAAGTPAGARTPVVAQLPTLARPAVASKPLQTSAIASGMNASAAVIAALARQNGAPMDPRYLVLDTGQVYAGELARQPLAGWLVRFNGSVGRNG